MHVDGLLPFLPFVIMVIVVVAIARRRMRPRNFSYMQCEILTPNEAELFGRLRAALPDHYVFPQVTFALFCLSKSYRYLRCEGDMPGRNLTRDKVVNWDAPDVRVSHANRVRTTGCGRSRALADFAFSCHSKHVRARAAALWRHS